jgi:hypothetical protein
MEATSERFIKYCEAILEGRDLSEFAEMVEFIKDRIDKIKVEY